MAPSPPPPAKHQQSRGASRWKGQASGTRASATQLPWERDPHKAPKLGIPPGAVSPAMCRRLSGHATLCSQGKWGRGGQPRSVPWDLSAQSGGASNLPSPWERPGVGSKDMLLLYRVCYDPPNEHTSEGGRDDRGVPYHAESTLSSAQVLNTPAKVRGGEPNPRPWM